MHPWWNHQKRGIFLACRSQGKVTFPHEIGIPDHGAAFHFGSIWKGRKRQSLSYFSPLPSRIRSVYWGEPIATGLLGIRYCFFFFWKIINVLCQDYLHSCMPPGKLHAVLCNQGTVAWLDGSDSTAHLWYSTSSSWQSNAEMWRPPIPPTWNHMINRPIGWW